MVNKFTDKKEKVIAKTTKEKKIERNGEIIKKGNQTFVVCPKCGWVHTIDTKKCRFCGSEL